MNEVTVFDMESSANFSLARIIVFTTYTGIEGLPFPLYLPFEAKLFISFLLLLTLFLGVKFKLVIFGYLISPDSFGPINALIRFDQLNSFCLGIVIMFKIVAINYANPLSRVFGNTFCEWMSLPGSLL